MNQVPRSSRLPPLALATGVAVLPLVMCTQPAICGLGVVALVILFGWCGVALSARRWLLPLLGVQLVALCLVRITGLWPCDIACQGGSHYQHLAGIPVVYPALAAYALLTAVAIRDALRGRWSPALGRIAYACAGCSLFYLWVAMRLGMECGFCRAVHLSTLLTLACLMPLRAGLLWCQALAWLGGAFLALNMVYHHRVVADVAGPLDRSVPTAGSGSPDAIVALRASSVYHAMVSGRTRGAATGRYRVIVVIDPHCPVCAEEYGPLCAAVLPARGPAIPTLALETLIMLRPSDPSGADLAATSSPPPAWGHRASMPSWRWCWAHRPDSTSRACARASRRSMIRLSSKPPWSMIAAPSSSC